MRSIITLVLCVVFQLAGQAGQSAPAQPSAQPAAEKQAAQPAAQSAVEKQPAEEKPVVLEKQGPGSSCVVLKRMGPADQVTSHMLAFGIRGKQFTFVEGNLPKGVKFHGRLTDHDVRQIQDKGGKIVILSNKFSDDELRQARESCKDVK